MNHDRLSHRVRWRLRQASRLPLIILAVTTVLFCRLAANALDLHFDYTSFDSNFKQAQFDALNYASINGNYMMTSTDNHRPEMAANGNDLAEFYNWLQQRYDAHAVKDGNLSADEIDAYVVQNSTNNGPKPTWLILNEISSSLWSANAGPPTNSTYRTWLMDVVTRLHDHYGYEIVTLAPFQNPGANDASWQALAQKSYVGIECYLSGTEVWNSGNSYATRLAWAQAQYQSSKNSYLNRGVPASRLLVTEHFANNEATYIDNQGNVQTTGWGRAGLPSAADWDTVLQIRQDAILAVGFTGFLAYNWGGNALGVTEAEQIQHEYYYRSRRVLATQKPQWLSDTAITVNNSTIPLSWSQPLNWLGGVPNITGAEANFWRTLSANRTITIDGNKTVGTLTLDSPFSYTISPGTGGSVIFNNGLNAARLASTQGNHSIGVNAQLVSRLIAEVSVGTLTVGGVVSGSADLEKQGLGTLALLAANTYTGKTAVYEGILSVATASFADSADVLVASGALLELDFAGSADTVAALYLGGTSQAIGIWGAVGSGAQYTSSLISGPGTLRVTAFHPLPLIGDYSQDGIVDAADYTVWRNSIGAAILPNREPANTGVVGEADFASWRVRFGQSVSGAPPGDGAVALDIFTVPEPRAATLLGFSATMLAATRRRQHGNGIAA